MGLTKQDGTQRALVTRGTTKERSLSGTLKRERKQERAGNTDLLVRRRGGRKGVHEEPPLEAIGATEINH